MPPPLPPCPLGWAHKVQPSPVVSLELFLDLCCPFSAKMFGVLERVAPAIEEKHPGKVQFRVFNVPQPWHAQSSYMHEVALAACQIEGMEPWSVHSEIFKNQAQFFDDATIDKTRKQIYEELAALVTSEAEKKEAILQKLVIAPGSGNCGHAMQQTLKFYVKYHRARSIHVTPTVLVNGLEAGEISSSFTEEQWMEWLVARL
eukprot:CAMPEP_0204400274 /NCGR_PEP_ID=MMETSP0470-20130426/4000_1 /ASSEMBLY_ACC=CAM_ASM_000385 /TAXON_ID=2969 /ORGANISM="Oxyrrhis marina" /LENGTH=201 /DNA_ID=CAMNT_0051395135 /DNA_START=54 /DNA_END=659 /DNA_ORIENTATION=-